MSEPVERPAKVTPLRRNGPAARYRVLLALEAAGGGAGRHVRDLAEGLTQRNHNVCIVYSPDRADEDFVDAIHELPSVSVHELPMRRAVGLHDAGQVRALRRLIRSIGPFDIAHGHSSKAGALLRLAARRERIPCIYTPHAFITLDPEISGLKRFAYGVAERRLAPLARRIICVSNSEYDHAVRLGIIPERLRVVHNGIGRLPPVDRRLIRDRYGLPDEAIVIGCVGRLAHQKAVERLLSAFAMGAADLPNARLMVVGDGPDRQMLEALASRQGLKSRILFTGAVDGASAMAAFDVFALPSRYEALPYVLLEAAARGLPIVMSDTGGAGSVVREGVNGFIVPQRDTEAFSARLLELCRKPFQRERMGQRSIEVARGFTADQMVMDTLAVYEECLPAGDEAAAG
jgi:glycosyltransferase involved in cell wall biosynthesis